MNVFHYSIDIETLDTRNTAVVTSVGGYAFRKSTQLKPTLGGNGREFEAQLDIDAQLRIGRTVSASTLRFWGSQDRDLFNKQLVGRMSILGFTKGLRDWMRQFEISQVGPNAKTARRIWVFGPHFDIAILQGLFEHQRVEPPWVYNEVRDVRTLVKVASAAMCGAPVAAANGTPHDALSDAKAQAEMVIQSARILGFDLDMV